MGMKWDRATCLHCGAQRTVQHREWIRAKAPRCLICGGPIEPSKAARKEHIEDNDAKNRQRKSLRAKQGFE